MSNIIKEEKAKFLEAYNCFNWEDVNSLGNVIGLIPADKFYPYEETPEDSEIFATTGTDGCHYCIVYENESISVYLITPNMINANQTKYLLGHSMSEFLSYLLPVAGMFEYIFECENIDEYLEEVNNFLSDISELLQSKTFMNDLKQLKSVYDFPNITSSDVYNKLKALNLTK